MRVATYNIHHGVGLDRTLDLERVATVVERLAADVVGLQEVDRHYGARSGRADQAGWLADRLGMRLAYGANLDLDPDEEGSPRRHYGSAILSRYPIEHQAHTLLPCSSGCEQRGVVSALVHADGQPVRLYTTHLDQSSRQERRAQARHIAEAVAAGSGPAVLVGDLNAPARSAEVRTLTRSLVDAWRAVGRGAGSTHRADRPLRRIDYVLYTPDLEARSADVVRTTASDHLPLVVDLALPVRRSAD